MVCLSVIKSSRPIKLSKTNNSPLSIEFIVSNNSKAKGLNYAKIYKIKKKVFGFKNKTLSEKKLLSILKINNITYYLYR